MAVVTLGKYQTHEFQSWKGLTLDNNLGGIFMREPQRATPAVVRLLAATQGKTLDTFLSQFPTKNFENDNEYFWDILGSAERNIPLLEARTEAGVQVTSASGNVGAGGSKFYLVFGEDWFADGEIIVGHKNELYQMRILGDARMEGTNAVYQVELCGGNTTGIPAERLLAGERFSVDFAPVEQELSRKVGDVRFTSPVGMRNDWTTIRIQHKVPGNKLNRKIAFGIPMVKTGPKGEQIKSTDNLWMHYVDWEMTREWNGYKNKALAFGRSNRNANGEYMNFGKSGNVIRMGAGIFEQCEVSNTRYYTDTDTVMDLILDSLYELSAGKIDFGQRKFVIKTGERGALLFNKAAKNTASGWLPLGLRYSDSNPGAISKTTAAFTSAAVRLTDHQITEWIAPNGVEVHLEVDSFYDDPVRNKILHPEGGVAFSYRFDIWYIGTSEGEANIQKCQIAGQPEVWGYQSGFRNPFTGQVNISNMSYDEDSAVFHKMATLGALVYDPTKTMAIIPSILQ